MKFRVIGPIIALVILGLLSVVLPRLILGQPNPDIAGSCSATDFKSTFTTIRDPGSGTYARVRLIKITPGQCVTTGWADVTVPVSRVSFANVDMVSVNFSTPPMPPVVSRPHRTVVHQGTTLEFFLHYPPATGTHCVISHAISVSLPGHPSSSLRVTTPKIVSCAYLLDVTPVS